MVYYGLHCGHCDTDWTVDRPMEKAPSKGKCPECGKMGNRTYGNAGLVFKGEGWDSNSYSNKRYNEKGMDKDTANEFLNSEIKNSKERMKSGGDHYKRMVISEKDAFDQGLVKGRISDEKAKRKADAAFKFRQNLDRKRG